MLKEEVVNLRQQMSELEVRVNNKAVALNSLNEFLKKQTEGIALNDVSSVKSSRTISSNEYEEESKSNSSYLL